MPKLLEEKLGFWKKTKLGAIALATALNPYNAKALDIFCQTNGEKVTISYDSTNDPNLVRMFNLNVSTDNGTITSVKRLSDNYLVTPTNIEIDSETGEVVNGSPISQGLGTSNVVLEMASLYTPGQNPPMQTGDLVELTIEGTGTKNIKISENEQRKGVIYEGGQQATNINFSECEVLPECPCLGDIDGDGWKSPSDVSGLVSKLLPYSTSYYWTIANQGDCGDMDNDGWKSPSDVSNLVSELLPHANSYYWVQCE